MDGHTVGDVGHRFGNRRTADNEHGLGILDEIGKFGRRIGGVEWYID